MATEKQKETLSGLEEGLYATISTTLTTLQQEQSPNFFSHWGKEVKRCYPTIPQYFGTNVVTGTCTDVVLLPIVFF
jgi:hypothetical protein